ncbi:hypothetical protein TNCV_3088911 [Trichonephila clavipes]|uniref:Uncharacterized protein n=1 Tax=Trichonephila clavipes TaxID=2585209 RepID=A0A8X6RT59_TRICX|nr:hypothetical protein TNCV_3088911 [Trichonephila clavipes]
MTNWAVCSVVVRASDSRPGGLGSMSYVTKYTMSTQGVSMYSEGFKSVGPKVMWVVAEEATSGVSLRIFPSLPVPYINCADDGRWYRHLSSRVPTCFSGFGILPVGKDATITTNE